MPDRASCGVKRRLSVSPTSVAIVFECSNCDWQGSDKGVLYGYEGHTRLRRKDCSTKSSCRADDADFV